MFNQIYTSNLKLNHLTLFTKIICGLCESVQLTHVNIVLAAKGINLLQLGEVTKDLFLVCARVQSPHDIHQGQQHPWKFETIDEKCQKYGPQVMKVYLQVLLITYY